MGSDTISTQGPGGPDRSASDAELAPTRVAIPRAERALTLLLLGRLKYRETETICRIRNVSAGGMRIDTGSPLGQDETVVIEAGGGVCIEGRVAWTSSVAAGIAFADQVDHLALLAPATEAQGGGVVARSPRFQTSATARLEVEGRMIRMRLADIWLGGCRVECDTFFPSQVEGRLTIPGLAPMACTSPWTKESDAELTFLARPEFATFARWLENPELRFGGSPEGDAPARGLAVGTR